jgi:hypothetical protein
VFLGGGRCRRCRCLEDGREQLVFTPSAVVLLEAVGKSLVSCVRGAWWGRGCL